jgi:large subunit ribosomal protein L10
MTEKTVEQIPEFKKKTVAELSDLMKNKKTTLVVSIRNIPGNQFQEIVKGLRGKAIVKVPKKSLVFRAIEDSGDEELKKVEDKIEDSFAFLFSDKDAFELAGELLKSKTPAKAKAGQEAPSDITIEAGPTELPPGPAISELGAVGLQVQVENGKLTIKESKVIVKVGEKISQKAADIMGKLDVKPFSIGFIPLCAYDKEDKKFYAEINIDPEGTLNDLKYAFGKALPFAVDIGYISEDTVKVMISKAGAHANKINRIMTGEPEPEAVAETPAEEKKEEQSEESKEKEVSGTGSQDSSASTQSDKRKEEAEANAGAGLGALFG